MKRTASLGRDFSYAFKRVTKYYDEELANTCKSIKLMPRNYYADPIVQQTRSLKSVHGDVLLQRIRNYLEKMPVIRSHHQKEFHEEFLRAVAPGLYGPSFEIEYQRILKQNGWTHVNPQAMVITPRRWGKTYCVGMFVAAYALAVPGETQSIFSTSARISQMMLELVYKFLASFPEAKKRIAKYTTLQNFT